MARDRQAGDSGELEAMISQIGVSLGQTLGEALLAGVRSGIERSGQFSTDEAGAPTNRRARSNRGSCQVPGCHRRPLAKGLCAAHYRKARRLDLGPSLSAAELQTLGEDGRRARSAGG